VATFYDSIKYRIIKTAEAQRILKKFTNYAESVHSRIKELLRVHRGFNSVLKQKIIKEILAK